MSVCVCAHKYVKILLGSRFFNPEPSPIPGTESPKNGDWGKGGKELPRIELCHRLRDT